MRKKLSKLVRKVPSLFFLYFFIRYFLEIAFSKHLIVVATPGLVGSSSVYASLKGSKWDKHTEIYDIHFLEERFNNTSNVESTSARHVLQEVFRWMLLNGKLNKKKITLITVIRDPIARTLSGVFQNPQVFLFPVVGDKEIEEENFRDSCEKLMRDLISGGFLKKDATEQLLYYVREFRDFWGMDFLSLDVQTEQGFLYAKKGSRQLLFFVLEHLDDLMDEKVLEYLGNEIVLVKKNSIQQRESRNLGFYEYCKKNLKINNEKLINEIYNNSPILRIMYSPHEISSFIKKWT